MWIWTRACDISGQSVGFTFRMAVAFSIGGRREAWWESDGMALGYFLVSSR